MIKRQSTDVEQMVYRMLLENTGVHFLDSGGADNRHWQHNQAKTITDFINEPEVKFDLMTYQKVQDEWKKVRVENSMDIEYTISVFHYLTGGELQFDDLCQTFNDRPVEDWDFDAAYGVSKSGGDWLLAQGAVFHDTFNTYNFESALSQVLQGTYVSIGAGDYVLLQIHGGCDVRGGYTDARLFTVPEGYLPPEYVFGVVIRPDKRDKVTKPMFGLPPAPEPVQIENCYHGYALTDECGNGVEIGPEDKVELWLGCN